MLQGTIDLSLELIKFSLILLCDNPDLFILDSSTLPIKIRYY